MAESFVEAKGVPRDTEKKKIRTRKRIVGPNEVHEYGFFLVDENGEVALPLNEMGMLSRSLMASPIMRMAPDSAGRLRIVIDVAGTATPVTQSGIWNLGNYPVDQRFEMIQRANIEYEECQRSKMTFT
jgi:hypothetical protein